jgi:serine/threonine protein kinase
MGESLPELTLLHTTWMLGCGPIKGVGLMKRCPKCNQRYENTITLCPRDRSRLIQLPSVYEGAIIGKYTVKNLIGDGGMAKVYRVEDPDFGDMAMKVMSWDIANVPDLRQRFIAEAKAMWKLPPQRNIVRVVGVDSTSEGQLYIVMEYVRGASLARAIQPDPHDKASRHRLDLRRALLLTKQVCEALEVAHRELVHRDIKPENILLTELYGEEVVKVLDFGIAKIGQGEAASTSTFQTSYGAFLGSPLYCSPEQAAGNRKIDNRSDIYSLGVVLWEMLTGQLLFDRESALEARTDHIKTSPRPPNLLVPSLTGNVVKLVMRALAKDPAARFQTATAMKEDVEALIATLDTRPPQSGPRPRPIPPGPLPRSDNYEYILSFATSKGDVSYKVPISHDELFNDIIGDLLADLRREYELKDSRGNDVDVLYKGKPIDQSVPLPAQGIEPGATLQIQSKGLAFVQELEAWLDRLEQEPAYLLTISLSDTELLRMKYAFVLREKPELEARLKSIGENLAEIDELRKLQSSAGTPAAFAEAARMLQMRPSHIAVRKLKKQFQDRLTDQVAALIDQYLFDDANKVLSEIRTNTKGDEFEILEHDVVLARKELERTLSQLLNFAVIGNFERCREIVETIRQKAARPDDVSPLLTVLSDLRAFMEWGQEISSFVSEGGWLEARRKLEEHTRLFEAWLPFNSILFQLTRLDEVEISLTQVTEAAARKDWSDVGRFLDDSLTMDLTWFTEIENVPIASDSLADIGHKVMQAAGQLVGRLEEQRANLDEVQLREMFPSSIRELTKTDRKLALERVTAAYKAEPSFSQLGRLQSFLKNAQ